MAGLRRIRGILPAALLALMLVSASLADDTVDFKLYPEGSQDCLYKAADSSKCKSGTVTATNSCLCRNGGNFITAAAACIGRSSRSNLTKVYGIMKDACDFSETPITVSQGDFMEAADGTTSTTLKASSTGPRTSSSTSAPSRTSATTTATTTDTMTSATTSSTSTGTPAPTTPPEEGESATISTGAIAGIIVGAIGGLALLGGLGYFLFRRRRKLGEESHPMLPQQAHLSAAPSGHDSTAYYSSPPSTAGWPKKDWGASGDPRYSGFNWESPAHLAYPAGALAPSPPLPIQELDGVQHFPPGSTEAPAEMGGTPVVTTPPPPTNTQYQPYNAGQQYPGSGWSQPQR
ncbi:hypothetical protein C8A00DRAFT_15295 [Chaetomidium leptoderma]|uniref:Extracellular membrane protein CFEM domain-containing protein n=1 Tax=Chaetomidium leptoderma TaxID=669021 RepID=A0AAN6VND7_9PEZI|nr:hypothetical protein C8A00DRAFT_15295 [Chaetomidium leptoderma]